MENINLIKQALDKAAKYGCYSLEEAAIILNAIQCVEREKSVLTNKLTQIENELQNFKNREGSKKSRRR